MRAIVAFIRRKAREAKANGVVLGLSGGVDSAVVAALSAKALGPRRVTALIMPEAETRSDGDVADAIAVANSLGIEYRVIDFTGVYRAFAKCLPVFGRAARVPNGNLRARIRMCLLYYYANRRNLLVAGTGNKSELLQGYFTRYGDGGVDMLPIGGLYKTQVRALARSLGIPERIIAKVPTAGLWPGQSDEAELGIRYEALDKVLAGILAKKTDKRIAGELGMSTALVKKVRGRMRRTEFKRRMPEIP